ncbi:hypothetical protein Scep_025702 [Stephania cephalantha]|uniref:Uncharacterized protein n=1 Tax=Stephania cephalantha TaxID=152367 RepID=A0AAP0EPB7_9MAGN
MYLFIGSYSLDSQLRSWFYIPKGVIPILKVLRIFVRIIGTIFEDSSRCERLCYKPDLGLDVVLVGDEKLDMRKSLIVLFLRCLLLCVLWQGRPPPSILASVRQLPLIPLIHWVSANACSSWQQMRCHAVSIYIATAIAALTRTRRLPLQLTAAPHFVCLLIRRLAIAGVLQSFMPALGRRDNEEERKKERKTEREIEELEAR